MISTNKAARGRPQTLDREKLLGIAVSSYWTDGTESVSVNDICRRAGISKPGLYREFQNEDGLKSAALEAYREKHLVPMYTILGKNQSFLEALEEIVEFFNRKHRYQSRQEYPEGCLHADMNHSRTVFGPSTLETIDSLNVKIEMELKSWFDHRKAAGEIRETMETASAVTYLFAQFSGALNLRKKGVGSEEVEKFLRLGFSVFLKSEGGECEINNE